MDSIQRNRKMGHSTDKALNSGVTERGDIQGQLRVSKINLLRDPSRAYNLVDIKDVTEQFGGQNRIIWAVSGVVLKEKMYLERIFKGYNDRQVPD